ncbi:hypothetical protein DFP72DRAFT_792556, partial [Ephemerocybe angulata]
LPVRGRPEEWTQWTNKGPKGARNHDHSPFIDDPAEIGLAITSWWTSIQPSFRRTDTGILIPIDTDADSSTEGNVWPPIRKSGTNGLLSLMMLLYWW